MIDIRGEPQLYQWETGRIIDFDCNVDVIEWETPLLKNALPIVPDAENYTSIPDELLQTSAAITVYAKKKGSVVETATFSVDARKKPLDYIYTPSKVQTLQALADKIAELEKTGGATDEQIENAVEKYLEENPIDGVVTDEQIESVVDKYLEENLPEVGGDFNIEDYINEQEILDLLKGYVTNEELFKKVTDTIAYHILEKDGQAYGLMQRENHDKDIELLRTAVTLECKKYADDIWTNFQNSELANYLREDEPDRVSVALTTYIAEQLGYEFSFDDVAVLANELNNGTYAEKTYVDEKIGAIGSGGGSSDKPMELIYDKTFEQVNGFSDTLDGLKDYKKLIWELTVFDRTETVTLFYLSLMNKTCLYGSQFKNTAAYSSSYAIGEFDTYGEFVYIRSYLGNVAANPLGSAPMGSTFGVYSPLTINKKTNDIKLQFMSENTASVQLRIWGC